MKPLSNKKEFFIFTGKVILIHTITYFIFGLIISRLLDYRALFEIDIVNNYMRPFDSPWVTAGPFLQPLRGLLYAVGLWPFRNTLLNMNRGWLPIWGIFIFFGILGTPAASPLSMEGVIYSRLPLWYHLIGIPELFLQTLALSFWVYRWDKNRYLTLKGESIPKPSPLIARAIRAIMVGCFGYMAFAVTAISLVFITGSQIDFEAAASDTNSQIVFLVIFIFNSLSTFFVGQAYFRKLWSIRIILIYFILLNICIPQLYWLFFGWPMSLWRAIYFGSIPGLIVAFSVARLFEPEENTE